MKKEHRALLEKCQPQLIQAIVSNRCLEDLICNLASQAKNGNDGLTPSDIKKIRKERHTCEDDKVKMFLDTLCKKIEVAYNRFIKVMIDTNQTRLISILNSELPPDQQIGNESSALTASTSSTSASSRKRRIPLDDNQEGSSGISDPKTIDSEKAMPAELKMPSTSSSSTYETHTAYSQDCRDNKGNQMNGGNFEGAVFNQQIYHYAPPSSQAPSTSSTTTSQPSAEDWRKKLKTAAQSLKDMYLTRFQKVYPFSLPFTFDIENTWVSLALKEEKKDSQATEDHAELLKRAFEKAKMLIIEGDPATGKTSLMRRLAYEWAKGKQELAHYDLALYAEFREVREKTFKSIADLVLGGLEEYLTIEDYGNAKKLVNNEKFCKECRILVILDGYDESSLEKQCSELSAYLIGRTINKALLYNAVITTRKGYLSNLRGREGRFVFAEVLGFTTKQQKEKYVYNHFLSSEIDNRRNIAAVHHLLANNENLNKLAKTPLFLTFICLVHERIVDGTLLELYCNIIWWLIDRHQQDFPDRDIPALFGFQNGYNDKFETIQDHYLHFPQLCCLGKMALRKLQDNVFENSDCAQFNLQPIIEQVGLLRKEKTHDNSFKLVTSFFFPHKTIQEFLAAFYCFYSKDPTSEWLLSDSKFDPGFLPGTVILPGKNDFQLNKKELNEFERFLLRIALSDKMPVQAEKRKYYFERITDINLNTTFDAFNTAADFDNQLINWFLSQCTNVQAIKLRGELNSARHERNMSNDTSQHNGSAIASKMYCPTLFSFGDLTELHSLTFGCYHSRCTFSASSQLSFTNCPSLKNLKFNRCEMKSSTIVGIATLPAINTVQFDRCNIDLATWQSITDQISNSNVKCLKLRFGEDFSKEFLIHLQQCNNVKMEITIEKYTIRQNDLLSFNDMSKLHSLTFGDPLSKGCTFSASSQLSFTNCPSLKNLKFIQCEMKRSTIVGIATLLAIDTVEFTGCTIDMATWQSITDQISNSNVKCLQLTFWEDFNKEFLIHLQQCNNTEKIKIKIVVYTIRQNDQLSISNLIKLHSLTFSGCTFSANSQLSFTNCPSLNNLKFNKCAMRSSTTVGIATLPATDTVQFKQCSIDLATWQSITDQISYSNVKCLQFSADFFVKETFSEFLRHLQKCERIRQIHVNDDILNPILNRNESVTANLALTARQLPALTSIIISDKFGRRLNERSRLSERNRERIEKAGQERNPHFSIKYV